MIRDDLSERLIHLTRDLDGLSAKERFISIVNSKQIQGNTRNIRGRYKCICFSEAPISAIGQILAKNDTDNHYAPYGFMFTKKYLFEQGARPVIYQPEKELDLLPEELKYRHVSFDLTADNPIDWTWEREWRFKTDKLEITPDNVTLIIPNREIENEFKENVRRRNIGISMVAHGIPASFIQDWHFIVLEDLGYNF